MSSDGTAPPRHGLLVERGEPLTKRVLGDHPRLEELQQVIGPTRLRPDTREPVATERLAADDGADRRAVDVDVATAQLLGREPDVGGRT